MHGGSWQGEEEIYDEWGYHSGHSVSVDFLLPTGIYIPMDIPRHATIREVKELLWKEAIHHPLFNKLVNQESYSFNYINNVGVAEEIVDENRHLSEIDLIPQLPVLKLVRSQGNIEEKRVVQEIHQLAGIKSEKDLNADPECINFRKEMREQAKKASKEREHLHWKALLEQQYPPSVNPHYNTSSHVLRDYGLIQLRYENSEAAYTIKVNPSWRTNDLTTEAVQTWGGKSKIRLPTTNPDDYVLKGPGKEFIVGEYEIHFFTCLQDSLIVKKNNISGSASNRTSPMLTLMHVGMVRQLLPQTSNFLDQMTNEFPPPVPDKKRQVWSLWHMDTNFSVTVNRAVNVQNVNLEKDKKLHIAELKNGTFGAVKFKFPTVFGPDCPLGAIPRPRYLVPNYVHKRTQQGRPSTRPKRLQLSSPLIPGSEYIWDEECFFEINVCDLPRNAKLCITICTKKAGRKKENNRKAFLANATPIAWVNMNVFDFKSYLKTGKQRLNCWLWPVNAESFADANGLKPSGYVMTNPNEEDAPFLELTMLEYNASIVYPSHDKVLEEAAIHLSNQSSGFAQSSKFHLEQLDDIMKKDRFDQMNDPEKELLWLLRLDCRDRYPTALPKIISSVKWKSHKDVALFQAMLNAWPPLDPERAMELLDCQYADQRVRDFAVKCLKPLRDNELLQYLMQLVQALKFESYVNSSLVRFVLERAWKNRKIGHFFFWHLKAEVSNVTTNIRFSLFLESYLYGNIPHMRVLFKQFEALNKMKTLNLRVKDNKIKPNEVKTRAKEALHDTAGQTTFMEALSEVESPLNPNAELESLLVKSCKVMNSKMRPLWLEFKNQEHPDGKISVIYKNGDDLRQDMLTLQIISIMDSFWKSEDLDLRMIPYGCLATGSACGMIEVVTHSNTIANIQKSKAGKMSSAFRHQSLYEWIEEQNPKGSGAFDQAIENFTFSCAGYCVATYVLGVGDRHSDNIMVTKNGQLFHIDFGHILGNFKSKYGIKRERVPFVLAHDFVHVINKGKTDAKKEFEVFRKLCDKAFLILRRKGYLFITLFALMLHSGLPELTSLDHLEYLRDTLALHVSEEKALAQFRSKFNKALTDAWSTSVNWMFHNVNRN